MNDKKTPLQIAFGKTVKGFRRSLDISQGRLAELSGLHINYIGGIERGERNVSLENIYSLAKALGCKPADLMVEKNEVKSEPINRLENIEMQLEILTETIKELRRGRN